MAEFIGSAIGVLILVVVVGGLIFILFVWHASDRHKRMKLFDHPNDIPKRFEVEYTNLQGEENSFWIEPFSVYHKDWKVLIDCHGSGDDLTLRYEAISVLKSEYPKPRTFEKREWLKALEESANRPKLDQL